MDKIIASDQPEWAHKRPVWRIFLTPIHVLGILASIYRISRRYKTRQSGLDDHAATLALILDLIFFPTLWLRREDAAQLAAQEVIAQVVVSWVVQVVYPLLTWTAKASIALTIARLIPTSHFTHKASIIMAYLSVITGLGVFIQTTVFCTKVDKIWSQTPPYICRVSPAAGSFRYASQVVADIFLVIIPFVTFFWRLPFHCPKHPSPTNTTAPVAPPPPVRLRLPPLTRRLLQVCFLASLLTTLVTTLSLVLFYGTQNSDSREIQARIGYMEFVLSHLNGSTSLLVCNLLIVITSLYRFLRTPSRIAEIGKSPVIQVPNLPTQENSGSVETGTDAPSNDTSVTRRERTTTEGNVSENSGFTTTGIELTELFESDFSMA